MIQLLAAESDERYCSWNRNDNSQLRLVDENIQNEKIFKGQGSTYGWI